jgi:hypothetical protein
MLLGGAMTVIAGLVFILVVLPGNTIHTSVEYRIAGLHATFRSTELHPLMTASVALLIVLTAAGTQGSRLVRALFAGSTGLGLIVGLWAGLPLLYVWVAASFARMVLQGRYALAALIACAFVLPAIAPTGSPTYAVYVLMLCTAALVVDWQVPEQWLQKVPRVAVAVAVCAVIGIASLLRIGIHVPVLGSITAPMVAERERTVQLETILAWWESSTYQATPIRMGQPAPNPVEVKDKADRRFRPPTSQVHLERYMMHRILTRGLVPVPTGQLVVLFGGAESAEGTKVYTLPGDEAGTASVYFIP